MINEEIRKNFLKKWKPKQWKKIDKEYFKNYKKYGEGIFYLGLKSTGKDIISKLIGLFCHGFVHTVICIYKEKLNDYLLSILSEKQYKKIIKALTIYYGNSFDIKKIKCLIISSSDSIGQTAFDVSNYQNRKHTLRKITKISSSQENKIVKFLVNHLNETYDYTGLIFYPTKWISKIIYKFFNSKYYFCSEISERACRQAHIKIAINSNPTPWDIEKFNAYPIIYNNIK